MEVNRSPKRTLASIEGINFCSNRRRYREEFNELPIYHKDFNEKTAIEFMNSSSNNNILIRPSKSNPEHLVLTIKAKHPIISQEDYNNVIIEKTKNGYSVLRDSAVGLINMPTEYYPSIYALMHNYTQLL